jgi:hypothetical protein
LATPPSVRVVNDPKEAAMLRIASRSLGIRLALLTTVVGIVAAIVPFVALAGGGDPSGF